MFVCKGCVLFGFVGRATYSEARHLLSECLSVRPSDCRESRLNGSVGLCRNASHHTIEGYFQFLEANSAILNTGYGFTPKECVKKVPPPQID